MAVVKMHKFTAIGIDTTSENVMTDLMEFGVAELNKQEHRLQDEEWAKLDLVQKQGVEISETEAKLNTIEGVIKTLESYDKSKKPLFFIRRPVTKSEFVGTISEREEIEANIDKTIDLINLHKELQNTRNKTETVALSLKPWVEYKLPLEVSETRNTNVFIGVVPPKLDVSKMNDAVSELTDQISISLIFADQEQQYVSVIHMKDAEEEVGEVLKQYGFNKVSFKDLEGSADENIEKCRSETEEITKKIEEVEKSLADMVVHKAAIELYYDYLSINLDKAKASDSMLATERTFYIDGWVPAVESQNLATVLEKYGCYYEITVPEKDEETPVLLKNNAVITPIEAITELYDTPNSREVDPTPVFAFFYVMFFGIMFADIGYGILLTLLSIVMLKVGKLEGGTFKFVKQLGYCGVSTIIWGVVFGSFFGNIIPVVSGHFFGSEIVFRPLWFDPVEDAMTMLIFACACGVVHIFVGLGVKAYSHLREGRVLDAINESFLWYTLLIGLLLLLGGDIVFAEPNNIGMVMSIIGAGGIILLPVYMGKGIGKLIGLWNLYNITRYLSDVLSYARLLGLCLAGAVIAQVFNTIATMPGSGVIGAIAFIVIVLAAHVFNFLVSALGAFVHAIRLQYVEFFSKFYEGGGTPFKPFMNNTKYVKIVKEEN